MADTADVLGDVAEEVGELDVAAGMDDLAAAGELEDASREALAAGSSGPRRHNIAAEAPWGSQRSGSVHRRRIPGPESGDTRYVRIQPSPVLVNNKSSSR